MKKGYVIHKGWLIGIVFLVVILKLVYPPKTEEWGKSASEITPLEKPISSNVNAEYIHQDSSIVFPKKVGSFSFLSVTQFDANAWDVCAEYGLTDPYYPITVTIYIYPAKKVTSTGSPKSVSDGAKLMVLQNEFKYVKSQIELANKNAQLITSESITMEQNNLTYEGFYAKYSIDDISGFSKSGKAISIAQIYQHEDWYIKYRITYAVDFKEKVEPLLEEFIQSFKWFPE